MSQNNPFVIEFENYDWDAIDALNKAIIEETTSDAYVDVDEDGDLVAVHESKWNRRTRKIERNAQHAKAKKAVRNA